MLVSRLVGYQPALRIKELIASMVIVANVPITHHILQFKGEVVSVSDFEAEADQGAEEENLEPLFKEALT